jgi:integrase
LEDWETIYYFFRTNKWKKNKNSKVEMQRRFITDFAMVLINTGIRFGEARRLLWKNVKFDKGTGRKKSVKISLSAEQTKTGVARKCIGRRGDVFDRIKSYSNFTSPNDYVFVNNETGAQTSRAVYYKNWNYLVRETGLDNHRTDTTFYCFRHTYASWRVMAGVDVFLLSKMMGCSVKYIEQHYGQPELDKMTEQLTRDAKLEEMSRFV